MPVGLPAGSDAVLGALGPLTAIDGEARWGSPMPVAVTLHFSGNPPGDIQARVHRALGVLLGEDLERLEKQYAPLVVQPAGNQAVRAEGRARRAAAQRRPFLARSHGDGHTAVEDLPRHEGQGSI